MALTRNRGGMRFIAVFFTVSPCHLVTLSLFLLVGCGGATAPEALAPPANPNPAKAKPPADDGDRVTLHVPGMTRRLKLE